MLLLSSVVHFYEGRSEVLVTEQAAFKENKSIQGQPERPVLFKSYLHVMQAQSWIKKKKQSDTIVSAAQ